MAKKKGKSGQGSVLATNRAARHEYHLLDRYEAGIVLTGAEVKSARGGGIHLKEAYAGIKHGEVYLFNAHITPYSHAPGDDAEPVRSRKLLLHAREIRKLARALEAGGMTLVPTRAYLSNGRIKIELALAKGKKLHDKREAKRKREAERDMERARSLSD